MSASTRRGIKTRAVREGNGYVINGRKIWTSTAQVTEKMLILTRTTPFEEASRPSQGMTLFYTDLDRSAVEVREIPKMGRHAVDSNMLFIDGLKVPLEDRIGEEGKGFQYILHGMNPERILIAAECVGLGRVALARAARYAKERIVFGRPIGQNQGIQHPLAERWVELEAAELLVLRAAAAYDAHEDAGSVGAYANAAKYFAGEAGHRACETAMLTHGGMGYAKEFHVERYLPRSPDRPHRPGHGAADPVPHRRAGTGVAEVVLRPRRSAEAALSSLSSSWPGLSRPSTSCSRPPALCRDMWMPGTSPGMTIRVGQSASL